MQFILSIFTMIYDFYRLLGAFFKNNAWAATVSMLMVLPAVMSFAFLKLRLLVVEGVTDYVYNNYVVTGKLSGLDLFLDFVGLGAYFYDALNLGAILSIYMSVIAVKYFTSFLRIGV